MKRVRRTIYFRWFFIKKDFPFKLFLKVVK